MHTDALKARLDCACAAADAARAITLPAFHAGLSPENKTPNDRRYDPVTQADKDCEKLLRQIVGDAFPDDGLFGEEYPDKTGSGRWSWCFDPIDGTRAFVAGVPVWSCLIAVRYDGVPVIGIIDLPALDERYHGAPAGICEYGAAWAITPQGTHAISTRPCADFRDGVLSCTEPLAMFTPGQRAAYEMIRRSVRFSRLGLDAYAYALLARGRIDIILEAGLQNYDIQAHIPIVSGAGGKITAWDGTDASNGGSAFAAGDPSMMKEIYPYLARAMD